MSNNTASSEYNTKTSLRVLRKKDGRQHLDEWKAGIMTECDKMDIDDSYMLAPLPSDHLKRTIAAPIQANYQTAASADDVKAFNKQKRIWTMLEANASGIMIRHLEGELKDVFINTTKTQSVYKGYEAVMKELLMDDETLAISLESKLDQMKQSPNETAASYLARIRKVGNDLKGIRPAADAVAITSKMASKLYYAMNASTSKDLWGIIEANAASKDFAKMTAIIESSTRAAAIRDAIHGTDARAGTALMADQQQHQSGSNSNKGNRGNRSNRNLGSIVPGKLFVNNIPFNVSQDELRTAFAPFGTLTDVSLPTKNGRPAGFAFITFADGASATRAKNNLNDKDIGGRRVRVREFREDSRRGEAQQAQGIDELPRGFALMGMEAGVASDDDFDIPEHERIQLYSCAMSVSNDDVPPKSRDPDEVTGLVDSGCSSNLSNTLLPENVHESRRTSFNVANGAVITSTGQAGSFTGTTQIASPFTLRNVQHVPGAHQTLISVHQLLKDGYDVWFKHDDNTVNIGNLEVGTTTRTHARDTGRGGVYPLRLRRPGVASLGLGIPSQKSLNLWHQRFMHAGVSTLTSTQQGVDGFKIDGEVPKDYFCESCVMGKMHQYPHRAPKNRDTRLLGAVSLDIVFPPKHLPSLGGAIGALGISVRSTGLKLCYALKSRSDVKRYIEYAREFLERQTGEKICEWHLDSAGENTSTILRQTCETLGISLVQTATEEHQQNGEIEGWFGIAFGRIRAHIHQTKAPPPLWADGLNQQCYIWNRTVHGTHSKTPYELTFGRRPTVQDLRVLFCLAYARVLPKNLPDGKLSPRAIKGRFIGMAMYDGQPVRQRGYKILTDDTNPNSVVISRDVYFVEDQFGIATPTPLRNPLKVTRFDDHHDGDDFDIPRRRSAEGESEQPQLQSPEPDSDEPEPDSDADSFHTALGDRGPKDQGSDDGGDQGSNEGSNRPSNDEDAVVPQLGKQNAELSEKNIATGQRNRSKPERYAGEASEIGWRQTGMMNANDDDTETGSAYLTKDGPKNLNEALGSARWKSAMDKEIAQMYEKGVFELVDRPDNVKLIPTIWVLKEKVDDITGESKCKARLVLDGRHQVKGEDYDKTFAPSPSMDSTRMMAAIRAERDMLVTQSDFRGAYLNSSASHKIYILQPKGAEIKGAEHKVILLNKALYGMCQAGMLWNKDVDRLLTEDCGMERCPFDPCVYRKVFGAKMIIAILHTDDMKIYADRGLEREVEKTLRTMASKYEMTHKDGVDVFLGIKVDYGDGWTTLDQHAYLSSILDEFQEGTNVYSVPWDDSIDADFDAVVEPTEEEKSSGLRKRYYRFVGKLQYLVNTRPDIAFYVGKLARFCQYPRSVHWRAGQRLLGYLRSTRDYRLSYNRGAQAGKAGLADDPLAMASYSDSDHAGDHETRRSTSGNVILLCGGAVIYSSKRQTTVADSTTAAEIIALYGLTKKVMWLRNMLNWIGYRRNSPTVLACDNKAAVNNCEEGSQRSKTKHMDIKYCFIRDVVRRGIVTIAHVRTEGMTADILTKPLGGNKCYTHLGGLGLTKGSVK
jgi:RNA recognition motif-containing protein